MRQKSINIIKTVIHLTVIYVVDIIYKIIFLHIESLSIKPIHYRSSLFFPCSNLWTEVLRRMRCFIFCFMLCCAKEAAREGGNMASREKHEGACVISYRVARKGEKNDISIDIGINDAIFLF